MMIRLRDYPLRFLAAVAALAMALTLAGLPLIAHAQLEGGGGGNKKSDQSDQTNSYTLSQPTYDQVQRVQKLLAANNYSQAISVAKDTLSRAKKESGYAEALINQLIAQGYLLEKNYDAAEPYLERIIQLNALQPQAQLSVVYELATIYLTQKKYDDSIRLYKEVMAQDEQAKKKPDPDLYYRIGLAYSFKGDYQQAYDNIQQAIQLAAKPNKDWYQNWFVVAYKLK
ncbi:MAG: tetratricopeptide repeat protein, partial [Terriglobia bacterium]